MRKRRALILLAALVSSQGLGPTLAGHHLGQQRSTIGRWVPCESAGGYKTCHPSDTVELLFYRDTLYQINLSPQGHESRVNSHSGAVEQWRSKYYEQARALFGEPDSVTSELAPEALRAYWNRSTWTAAVRVLVSYSGYREHAYTSVYTSLFTASPKSPPKRTK